MSHSHSTPENLTDIITIWPYRSLSNKGFLILMAVLAALAFCIGLGFFLIGAWPVIGFLGLELVVVYIAFRLNYRSAKAYEQLLIHQSGITIIRLSDNGTETRDELASLWLKAEIIKQSGKRKLLGLRLHSQFHEIGAFLPPAEKSNLKNLINERIEKARLA
ncbi:MAG: DUF2244 domain-containing protein [Candidatus Puniceispirillaceae bacterium]